MGRILVVDDDADILALVALTFEKEGHAVMKAADGTAALAQLGLEPEDPNAVLPDVIILDVMMPKMDGYTLTTRLLSDERLRAVPVVVLTAKARMRETFATAANVAAYLEKPFDPRALRATVVEILSRPRPERP